MSRKEEKGTDSIVLIDETSNEASERSFRLSDDVTKKILKEGLAHKRKHETARDKLLREKEEKKQRLTLDYTSIKRERPRSEYIRPDDDENVEESFKQASLELRFFSFLFDLSLLMLLVVCIVKLKEFYYPWVGAQWDRQMIFQLLVAYFSYAILFYFQLLFFGSPLSKKLYGLLVTDEDQIPASMFINLSRELIAKPFCTLGILGLITPVFKAKHFGHDVLCSTIVVDLTT